MLAHLFFIACDKLWYNIELQQFIYRMMTSKLRIPKLGSWHSKLIPSIDREHLQWMIWNWEHTFADIKKDENPQNRVRIMHLDNSSLNLTLQHYYNNAFCSAVDRLQLWRLPIPCRQQGPSFSSGYLPLWAEGLIVWHVSVRTLRSGLSPLRSFLCFKESY